MKSEEAITAKIAEREQELNELLTAYQARLLSHRQRCAEFEKDAIQTQRTISQAEGYIAALKSVREEN